MGNILRHAHIPLKHRVFDRYLHQNKSLSTKSTGRSNNNSRVYARIRDRAEQIKHGRALIKAFDMAGELIVGPLGAHRAMNEMGAMQPVSVVADCSTPNRSQNPRISDFRRKTP